MNGMNTGTNHIQRYLTKGQRFLGVDVPIICGAMSSVSERSLVSAVCRSGGFGVLAGGGLSPDALSQEIEATCRMTAKPFGVNLILHNKKFSQQFDVALEAKPEIIVFAGAIPDRS